MKTYDYENGRRIHLHKERDRAGMEVAEVSQGLTTMHQGTPWGCLCWLVNQGDKKALAQLEKWKQFDRMTRKIKSSKPLGL